MILLLNCRNLLKEMRKLLKVVKDIKAIENLIGMAHEVNEDLLNQVNEIVQNIKKNGNQALFEYTRKFDQVDLAKNKWIYEKEEIQNFKDTRVDKDFYCALEKCKENIYAFHEKQKQKSWWEIDALGNMTGQIHQPLERVGLYVPGGTAAYPSSVLMTALPAKVAGVKEIMMITPPSKEGGINPYTLTAAQVAGVDKIYAIGGAQGIAALAYGTETIRKVDKIVGPGNIYVTLAKKLVYGSVDIDMLAGPSEILIIADEKANPSYLASDLLSQAEHDPLARAILLTTSEALAMAVNLEVEKQIKTLNRQEIAKKSLENNGLIGVLNTMEEAISMANRFAPEHLEVQVENPISLLGQLKNAGAIFLGEYSPEPLGDYYAGPNHVLPTGGTAKFYSPLNVDMYMKKSSLIYYTKAGLKEASQAIIKVAEVEGLDAHANTIKIRME
jgi:histidinol dehydrogenase